MENSSPNPSFSICDTIQKQMSRSFAKTSSALVPPPARSIEGRTPKKNVLSFLEEKIGRTTRVLLVF